MDSLNEVFALAGKAEAARAAGARRRVFDWVKAAQRIKEAQPLEALAGLCEDWFWTGGVIWENGGIPTESHPFLSSNWATPVLVMDEKQEECWVYQDESPGWDAKTYWPDEARRTVEG